MAKVLVTGGAGYIGSVLTRLLLERGHQVTVADALLFGKESLAELEGNDKFKLLQGDLRDETFTAAAVKDQEVVVHLAAIVGDAACSKLPELAQEVNSIASRNLFRFCQQAGVKHFIFSSTCSNYGVMKEGQGLLTEDSPLNPVSLYAEQKTAFEKFLLEQSASPVSRTILRFSTAYGLSPRMRFDLTVNHFTRDLSWGHTLKVFGKGLWRSYCHVLDLAESVLKVIEAGPEATNAKIYNVGDSAENYSKETIVNEVLKLAPEAKVEYSSQPTGDLRDYRIDFSRIALELGFKVRHRVADGIREIHALIQSGTLADPFAPQYRNI